MVELFNIIAIICGIGFIIRFLKEIKEADINEREEFHKKEDHK